MPARKFARICGRAARPSLCETPALAKPTLRYLSFWDSVGAFWKRKKMKNKTKFIRKKVVILPKNKKL
jgi:hypothetical protein